MATTKTKRRGVALAIVGFVALGGCQPNVVPHGNIVQADELAEVEAGVTTRQDVLRLLGSPSMQGTFDDRRWYYVAQQTEDRSFFDKRLATQDVVEIEFDAQDRVTDVRQSGLESANAIVPADDKTRTLGSDVSLIGQLLGNIGRFGTGEAPGGAPGQGPSGAPGQGPGIPR